MCIRDRVINVPGAFEIPVTISKNLLKFDGVELVLVSEKFISVKKNDDVTFFRVGVDIADTDNLFIDQDDVMLSLAYDDYHKKIIISINHLKSIQSSHFP